MFVIFLDKTTFFNKVPFDFEKPVAQFVPSLPLIHLLIIPPQSFYSSRGLCLELFDQLNDHVINVSMYISNFKIAMLNPHLIGESDRWSGLITIFFGSSVCSVT